MSDALTDIARDERRLRLYHKYLKELLEYLKKPTINDYKEVIKAAEEVDSVSRGYWGRRTNLREGLEESIKKLKEQDEKEWAKFLASFLPISHINKEIYKKFKEISPFKDKTLILVDYGNGFVNISLEDLEQKIYGKLRKENLRVYDCDKYIVAIDEIARLIKEGEIFWVGCGRVGINGPRTLEGKLKK